MLVLTRRVGEEVVIAGDVRVTVLGIQGQKVRLGVAAPRSVVVDRQEMVARRTKQVLDPAAAEPAPPPVPAPAAPGGSLPGLPAAGLSGEPAAN